MKLILKEYLASLREREELDAVLPDLLSQMGLNVLIKPSRGVAEYGVDVVAIGSIKKGEEEKLYLFSIKDGDLTRDHWSNGNQALAPSLEDIKYTFIRNRILDQFKDLKIVICICFGGEMHSSMSDRVVSYIDENKTEKRAYEIWNGDYLATLISAHLLSGSILPWKKKVIFNEKVININRRACFISSTLLRVSSPNFPGE
ncbi:hypothetical protein V6259_00365 [Marinomonas sp. TI.3.20]|uniref:hypothetical protein n=1 Tax=Marinomonas sp. TI.3.20 TaxID=3121296 RepID=UPI00311FE00D